jgi:hypothetical protein
MSGSSEGFLKSREFKSSKSKNAELLKLKLPPVNPLETEEPDEDDISMMSVTTNKNEQPKEVDFTEQLE